MAPPRTLLVVLAGGAGSRLESLTDGRAKPALPLGGTHRLIDVPLSHARNSGISDVWVLEQFYPTSINRHLAGGRPWDLDRTDGGLMVLGPHQGDEREGWHDGTADALWRKAGVIAEHAPDVLLVVSADAVYRMDFADVVDHHLASGAAVTMVTTRHEGDRSRYGVVEVDDGAVTGYAYKPDEPATDLVTTEVFAFDPRALREVLEQSQESAGEEGLGDLGEDVLPVLVERGQAVEFRHTGFWQDVGTVPAYWRTHMAMADGTVQLEHPDWPVVTRALRHGPARVSGSLDRALVSAGCVVEGTVRRSVLSPGVRVEAGAVVEDAVLLDDVVVRAGAQVRRAIVDERSEVRATVGGPPPSGTDDADDGRSIALVAAGSVVETNVPVGGRFPAED